MLLTSLLLRHHVRRAYGPLARIERDGTWLDVVDGSGRPTLSFPGTNGKAEERALEFLQGMPRWDTRPWWRRALESVGGVLLLPVVVRQVRRYLGGQS